MAENITVAATWRMSRVEFITPYSPMTGTVIGYGEYLLEEPVEGGAGIMGTMPGGQVARLLYQVKDETVEIGGVNVSVMALMAAMDSFFHRWRAEDQAKPPPETAEP